MTQDDTILQCSDSDVYNSAIDGASDVCFEILLHILKRHLVELTEGHNEAMPRSEKVCIEDVRHTLEWLSQEVNVQAEKMQEQVRAENRNAMVKFCAGTLTSEELVANWKEEPRRVKTKQFKHMARKFVKKHAYTKQRVNSAGSYLSYNDAKMQQHPSCTML